MDFKAIMQLRDDPNSEYYVPRETAEIVPVKGARNGIKRVNGHLLPRLCRNLSVIKSMEVREDDTFVVTYPKSGTHWVAELCWLINSNCDFEAAKTHHMSRVSFIDLGWSKEFHKKMASPRVLFTHLRYEFLPDNIQNRAKVVYVVRNPKDVLVSLFYFIQKAPEDQYDGTMEELFDQFMRGEIMYGAWWEHINEYAKINNIHFVHFEDLLEDSINETRKLAKFLGHDLSDEQIKKVVDHCSFDNMKNSSAFHMKPPAQSEPSKQDEKKSELSAEQNQQIKMASEMKLFRKGQIGDWKNYFTEEKWKAMDEIVATKLDYKKPIQFEPRK